jgi:hypothetical protein
LLDWYIGSLNAGLKHCRPNLTLSQHSKPLPAMAAAMKAMKVMKKKAAMKVMKKKAAMKVMKKKAAMKAMKARRAMKKKSVIATGRLAKVMVLRGSKAKTVGGLKASDLVKNKAGRVVSKKQSAQGKKNVWIIAVKKARAALKIKGFCAIKKGTPLYAKAKEFLN